MHNIKLLELVAINKVNEKNYLHIRLSSEDDIEFYWNIDNATINNIETIFNDDGQHRYRISLNSTLDITTDQFTSSITKTYRDISDTLYFDCSLQYISNLDAIKNSQSVAELVDMPFISCELPVFSELATSSAVPIKDTPVMTVNEKILHVKKTKKHVTTVFSSLFAIIGLVLLINIVPKHYFVNKIESTVVTAAQPPINVHPVYSTITDKEVNVSDKNTAIVDSTTSSLPNFNIENSLTYSISKDYVALTFDDGPSKYTKSITDILKQNNVGGTFFFLGDNAKKYPDSVRYVFDNGYSIGNHTMSHPVLTKLTAEEQEKQILQSVETIEDITNQKITLFRPPYGAINEQIIEFVQNQQTKTVLWNKDPRDWKTKDAEAIISYIREANVAGAIIILHESQAVIDALPTIIDILQQQNLQIVNLE